MSFSSALIALSLLASVPQDQTGAITVGGKQIPLRLVSTPVAPPPEDFLTWDGWQYLSGEPRMWTPYRVAADWSDVGRLFEANKQKTAPSWRTKIFLITSTESLAKDPTGVLRANRDIMSDEQVQESLEAIARFKAWVTAETAGRVELIPDVEVERDPLYLPGYGADFANWYIGPRINGGSYDADDKVFRGPYNGAMYVLPGYSMSDPELTWVNGTPTNGVHVNGAGVAVGGGRLEAALRDAWRQQVLARAAQQGFAGTSESTPAEWPALASLEEPPTDTFTARLRSGAGIKFETEAIKGPFIQTWKAPGSEVAIVTDADRGKVLKVSEKITARQGGVALPSSTKEVLSTIEATPTLSFFAKAADRDPISIRVQGREKAFWVSVGRDPILAESAPIIVGSVPFESNSQWQSISVDLRPLAKAAGVTEIIGLAVEPSPNALVADMAEQSNAEYFFDDFKLSSEPATSALLAAPVADLASTDAESRALAVAQATASTPAIVALLKDPSPLVRLNAVSLFTRVKDAEAETALAFNVNDLQPPIQALALQALAFQGTESARTVLRNTIKFTLGDYVKAQAATRLAETGDAKYTGDMLILFTANSWQTAIAAAQGLARVNAGAPQARHVFLRANSPAVRLAVIELADAKVATDRSALQWHALNDPSDQVRVAAYAKLIASGDAATAAEGYKGIRDDSRYARILLLDKLAASPSPAHKDAILLGLTDKSASVRAAALRALAVQPGPVTNEELSAVLVDLHPDVQLALAKLAAQKKLKLPAATLASMQQSPAKNVQDAAKALSG